ncbi:hypothetical protein K4L44_13125 [Halosquirtibacter laminarini]|uniref:Uncharacterized protein n=1 Tax=Halosquirtibacter laminarini TaxID=3374600 RepID=A0AC61NQX4_9BACT|nr:hypothetical protein K4L44_13125 [Prolixibacteraceae bacterium]
MTNKLYILCLALFSLMIVKPAQGQENNNTSSPLSSFGVGELSNNSTGRSNSMGGTAIGIRDRNQINPTNPASYTARDSMSMVFEMGASGKQTRFNSSSSVNNTNDSNFDYIALSFRINDGLALAFGLQPYTNKGFNMLSTKNVGTDSEANILYNGSGSVTKFFFGTGVKVLKNLSLGVNADYYFGTLSTNYGTDFKNALTTDTYFSKTNRIRGLGLDAGLQYDINLKDDKLITIGAVYKLGTDLTRDYDVYDYYNSYVPNGQGGVVASKDTINYSTGKVKDVNIPYGLGLGFSFVNPDKLTVAADFYTEDWSNYNDNIGQQNNDVKYTRRYTASAGIEWIPEKYALRNYFKRISYRAGVKMENDYFTYKGNNIHTYAVTAGLGLPIARQRSTLNIGIEFGTKGSATQTAMRQDYTKLYISFALHDYWFFKRKID